MDPPAPNLSPPSLLLQRRRNLSLRDAWQRFQPHRQQVMRHVLQSGPASGGVAAFLGAGNCNDLDLRSLLANFRELHLVDWDAEALQAGLAQQGVATEPQIVLHPGHELTGIAPTLAAWAAHREQPPSDAAIAAAIETAAYAVSPLPKGTCDVVASVCLLSQLLESVSASLPTSHPQFLPLLSAVRRRHLQMLVELLRPGGTAFLITDLVSSDTAPALLSLPLEKLAHYTSQLLAAQNFFTGLNPAMLIHAIQTEGCFVDKIENIRVLAPWFWDPGPRRYVVFGISFRRN